MNKLKTKKIFSLRKRGWTFNAIGLKFNLSRQRIQQICRYKIYGKSKCIICNKSFLKIATNKKIICDDCNKLLPKSGRDRTREAIRLRDKHTCKWCGKEWEKGKRKFDIHHLNGICGKKSRGYDSIKNIDELITYCHKCHLNLEEVKRKMAKSH